MNLFRLGNYTLSSGKKSRYKIHCEMFSDNDWNTLAWMIFKLIGPFSSVEGIPTGGTKLAQILKHYKINEGPHLIVDDVLTTGSSMNRCKENYHIQYDNKDKYIVGAVVFARGPLPIWIKAVYPLPKELWNV